MSQTNRRAAREQAFALLFELSFHPGGSLMEILNTRDDDTPEPDAFAKELALCAEEHLQALDEEIAKRLKGWKLNRISRASLAILRMAACEICHFDDIPVGASINEAVELAKVYAEDEAPKFINGVLGTLARDQESGDRKQGSDAKSGD